MGRPGSGRPRTNNRGTLEAFPRLDIRSLVRGGLFQAGFVTRGKRAWSHRLRDGSPEGISITVDLTHPQNSFANLEFVFRGETCGQRIAIIPKAMRFGGVRFYFQCPFTGRACEVLACFRGIFASPQFHKLTYRCQSMSRLDRTWQGITKLEDAIWPEEAPRSAPRRKRRQRFLTRLKKLRRRITDLGNARFSRQKSRRRPSQQRSAGKPRGTK
jgi:hypothetical protein